MKIVTITGASGFVGSNLVKMFESTGYKVLRISRSTLKERSELIKVMEQSDIVINLAGANILARWSDEYKKTLYSSRIETTKRVVEAMSASKTKPELFISTSAVGIYNHTDTHAEDSRDYANDFLAKICLDWESGALKAKELGIRTAIFRFGIILGDGGALSKMLIPFSLGLGGSIGDGSQAFPFIHIEDLKRVYLHIVQNENLEGIFNLVAPQIITNKQFTKALSKALHRPAFFNVPEFAVRILFGEGAKVLTSGQKVIPKRLIESGFEFRFETIEKALFSAQAPVQRDHAAAVPVIGKMGGLKHWCNVQNTVDIGGDLTIQMLRDMFKIGFYQSMPTTHIFVSDTQKDRLDDLFADKNRGTYGQTILQDTNYTQLDNFAYAPKVKVILSPYVAADEIIGINAGSLALVYQRLTKPYDLARNSDSIQKELISELTLRVNNPYAVTRISGLTTA
ncbi:MAG: TIGR01777 family protein [Arcobacter sp.]|nr:TIGR01777 family protein [Arcobacter sp.]